jgi:hypothetical protein
MSPLHVADARDVVPQWQCLMWSHVTTVRPAPRCAACGVTDESHGLCDVVCAGFTAPPTTRAPSTAARRLRGASLTHCAIRGAAVTLVLP